MQALIFDVDGTLADTESAHLHAFNAAFAEAGL
ncbi:HAD hydrolase-like protein, partial [Paraburkholderia caledonica]